MKFSKAIEFTLDQEVGPYKDGGYTNDPDDPGGETKWGISKRAYPDLDIKRLTRKEAIKIYERDYWEAAGCPELPPEIRLAHFDLAVNSGVLRAKKLLQSYLGVKVDGIIGQRTIATAHVKALSNPKMLEQLLAARQVFYAKVILNRYKKAGSRHRYPMDYALKYATGWSRRLFLLLTYTRSGK